MKRNLRTWTVGYQKGGYSNFSWHRTVAFPTKAEADQCAEENRRMGYPSLVYPTDQLTAIGLPETFLNRV